MSTLSLPPPSIMGAVERLWQHLRAGWARADAASPARQHHRAIHRLQEMWVRNHLAPHLALFGLGTPQDLYLREIRSLASQLNRRLHVVFVGADDAGIGYPLELYASGLAERITVLVADAPARCSLAAEAASLGVSDSIRVMVLEGARVACQHAQDVIVVDDWQPARSSANALCHALDALLAQHGLLLWTGNIGCRAGTWPAVEAQIRDQLDAMGMEDPRPRQLPRSGNEPSQDPAGVVAALAERFEFELFHTYGGAVLPYINSSLASVLTSQHNPEQLLASIERYDRICLQERMYPPARMIATLQRVVPACMRQHTPLTPREFMALVDEQTTA